MTSRAGRKIRRCELAPAAQADAWWFSRRPRSRGRRTFARTRGAFTLLEIVLSLGLLVLLAGVTIGVFWGVLGETRTQESANRMSALLRIARAEAANAGRRFRLSFDEQTGQPVVSIEADPLAAPGAFQPYASWWARQGQLQEGTRVALCRRTGDSAFLEDSQASEGPRSKDEAALEEIHFYTDGSSDSARIVLTNDDEEHPWAVEITLNGLDGTIATREIDTAVEPIE